MSTEEWKEITGYAGKYEVSNLGRVRSIKRNLILKERKDSAGYPRADLYYEGKVITKRVHLLVAQEFLGYTGGDRKIVVDHINEEKDDNRLCNLQVISSRENTSRSKKNGTSQYVGVCKHTNSDKWKAAIRIDGKVTHLGYFDDEMDAANAYKAKLKEINK